MNYIDEAATIALIIAITQLSKSFINVRYIPLLAVGLGVLFGIGLSGINIESGIKGLIMGLTASGLYDNSKIVKTK